MLPTLNYEAILSDPLLLLAGVFLIAGPLVFLISLFKFVSWGRKQKEQNSSIPFDTASAPPAPAPVVPEPLIPPAVEKKAEEPPMIAVEPVVKSAPPEPMSMEK